VGTPLPDLVDGVSCTEIHFNEDIGILGMQRFRASVTVVCNVRLECVRRAGDAVEPDLKSLTEGARRILAALRELAGKVRE